MKRSESFTMTSGNLWKNMFIFSVPLMFTNLLQVLFNMSDIAVVGQFAGSHALGAVGSTSILITLFTGFVIGLGNGVNALAAKYIGAQNEERLRRTIHSSILVCLFFGLLITLSCFFLAKPLLSLIQTKESLLDDAALYFQVYILGMPALAIYNYGNGIFSALGETKKPLLFLSLSGVLNIGLNLLLVIPIQLGVLGVAIASIISQYLSGFLVILFLCRRKDQAQLHLTWIKPFKKETKELLALGIPAGLQNALFAIANLFIQFGINTFDEITVEGNSAAMNYDGLVYDIMASFYMAGASFCGQNFGARNKKRILQAYLISLVYSLSIGALLGFILFCFPKVFVSVFTNDPEVIEKGVIRLSIMGATYFVSAAMDAPTAACRGLGKALIPTLIEITGVVIFRITWIFTVFQYYHTIESIYIVFVISWIICLIFENIYFAYCYRQLDKRFALMTGVKDNQA